MATASLESERKGDTAVVNISEEGTKMREECTETPLTVQEDSVVEVCDGIGLTIDPILDQTTPPPAYQEHNDFHQSPPLLADIHPMPPFLPSTQVLPSLLQSRYLSPPPSYSQIDLSNPHLPFPTPCLPSHLGGPSSHIPSQLGPGGTRSHLGGARPQKLQQTNQQMTSGRAGATNGQRMGYEWLQMVSNGQRILNVRAKEEEEQQEETSAKEKRGVAIGLFIIVFVVFYLILPYTTFSPWD